MTNAEVAYRASSKGIEERNELVLRELPQVYYVAARIRERLPKHVDMEDLVQAGVIGLLDACRNYDSAKDAQFSTLQTSYPRRDPGQSAQTGLGVSHLAPERT
jgi:RNA polymerase sigma factor for flagellar operon FliA